MKLSDIGYSLFIVFIFSLIIIINLYIINFKNVINNWEEYRCNPLILPFAGLFGYDAKDNFTECIRSYQTHFIGDMMGSLFTFMDSMMETVSDMVGQMEYIRQTISSLASAAGNIFDRIINMFVGVLIQFQRITVGIKDTFGKMVGVTVNISYMVSTAVSTGRGIWKGPIGDAMKTVSDIVCFHPHTKIKMKNGNYKNINEINIGDMLWNNNEVIATMKIRGNKNDPLNKFYRLYSKELKEYIYVTGYHKMMDCKQNIIHVKDHIHSYPVSVEKMSSDYLSCLVTKSHTIPIGEYTFMDWEYF